MHLRNLTKSVASCSKNAIIWLIKNQIHNRAPVILPGQLSSKRKKKHTDLSR